MGIFGATGEGWRTVVTVTVCQAETKVVRTKRTRAVEIRENCIVVLTVGELRHCSTGELGILVGPLYPSRTVSTSLQGKKKS